MKGELLEAEDVVLLVGKRGTGKSHRAKQLLAKAIAAGQRVIVADKWDEYSVHGRPSKKVDLGPCQQRVTLDQLDDRPELLDFPSYSYAVLLRQRPQEMAEDFEHLVDMVLDTGDVLFAADELGTFEGYCRESIDYLATQSRHAGDGVSVILAAQRMVQIPKTARTQASVLYTFKQNNPEDLDAVAKLTGCPEDYERVRRLSKKRHEFIRWDDDEDSPGAEGGAGAKPPAQGKEAP